MPALRATTCAPLQCLNTATEITEFTPNGGEFVARWLGDGLPRRTPPRRSVGQPRAVEIEARVRGWRRRVLSTCTSSRTVVSETPERVASSVMVMPCSSSRARIAAPTADQS